MKFFVIEKVRNERTFRIISEFNDRKEAFNYMEEMEKKCWNDIYNYAILEMGIKDDR